MSDLTILKEREQAQTPLLLFDVTFADGTVYHWSTQAATCLGATYQARVLRHNFFEIQAMSEDGLDQIPRLTLILANADAQMSQLESGKGFKGATVTARFLFYDLVAEQPASEALVPFKGYFNPPDEINDLELQVTAINRMNLQRVGLPGVKIQRRCPWAFPATSALRAEAAADPNSRYYACGYSPDVAGGCGKLDAGGLPFAACTYTRQDCIARGMFSQDEATVLAAPASAGAASVTLVADIAAVGETIDIGGSADPAAAGFAAQEERQVTGKSGDGPFVYTLSAALKSAHSAGTLAGRPTRRFGGIEFTPETIDVRPYGSPFFLKSAVQGNPAKYNDAVPMIYGTAWIEPVVTVLRNDGNLTRMEMILSLGRIAGVRKVVVNDYEIPEGAAGRDMTPSGWYNRLGDGSRYGCFDLNFADKTGNPQGDPYGSLATLFIAVPSKINDGKSIPTVKVLLDGRLLETFDGAGQSQGWSFSNNPAWVLLDLLKQAGWKTGEMDVSTFAAAAVFAAETIPATDNNGSAVDVPRFQCNLVLRQRRTAADVVLGVRNNARLFFTYGLDGRLRLQVEDALAAQQPAAPFGSNVEEEQSGGWPAYGYSESSILRKSSGASSLRVRHRPIADTPNRFAFEFQDAFNGYVQDAFAIDDLDDQRLVGQEISQTLAVDGIPTYDQAARIAKFHLDKSVRGNTFVEFETSVKALGQQVGQIITISYAGEGWVTRPFRILKIAPQRNFRQVRITAQAHDDAWYPDSNGQAAPPGRRPKQPRPNPRPPNPLCGTKLRPEGGFTWDLSEAGSSHADGSSAVDLLVPFAAPLNHFSTRTGAPAVDLTALVAPNGGSLAGGASLFYAVTAGDSDGLESPPSFAISADTPEGTQTNTATLTGISLDSGAVAFSVYRGPSPSRMFRIAAGQAPSASFTDDGLLEEAAPMPDPFFDHANFYWKFRLLGSLTADIFGPDTIGHAGLAVTPDQYRGYLLRIVEGRGSGQLRIIFSHTADTFTTSRGWAVEPDSSSVFHVEEPDWKLGSSAESSPARFAIPNDTGRVLLVEGLAADNQDLESPAGLAPLEAWTIGGAGPGCTDQGIPPEPQPGITVPGDGTVVFTPIGFETMPNTSGIRSATYQLLYVDELSPVSATLSADAAVSDLTFTVNSSEGFTAGDLAVVEGETVRIEEINEAVWTVTRALEGSTAAAHAAGKTCWKLSRQVFTYPFTQNFFSSVESQSWRSTESLPCARLAVLRLQVDNAFGPSPEKAVSLLVFQSDGNMEGAQRGLRTNRGGQFLFQVEGVLFLESAPTPALPAHVATSIRDVYALAGSAPAGAALTAVLRRNGEAVATLSIPADATVSPSVSGASLPPLAAGDLLTFDITSVGTTDPGRDLTLVVRI
jgi:hypothetical protein